MSECQRVPNRSQIPPVTFRDRTLEKQIGLRVDSTVRPSMGLVAKRDLRRLYVLLERELATLDLDAAAACMVCDALQGMITVDDRWRSLWAAIDDGVQLRDLAAKWGIAPERAADLVERIRRASPGVSLALCDAAERFWILLEQDAKLTPEQAAAAVGLVTRPTTARTEP